jgi:uncharacterized protein
VDRLCSQFLASWKESASRKPLVLRGARQTGKTWLVQNVGKTLWGDVAYVNFERDPDAAQCFSSNDPRATIAVLEARLKRSIVLGKNLLFLDEIQAAPGVLAKLRWFHEELPQLHVVAAGSLLDFALANPAFSMPVGRISYAHIEPMTFAEFLLACGEERLNAFIRSSEISRPVPDPIHDQLMKLVRTYSFVGGMPAAVAAWVETRSYQGVAELQRDLLQTMRDDFAKYESVSLSRVNTSRVAKVFASMPKLVGRKFMPSEIDREEKSFNLKEAFRLLSLARVVTPVQRTFANGVPIGAEVDERYQKVCFLDVGLYTNMTGLDASVVSERADLTLINEGQLAEQLVGQELRACRPFNQEPQLFTWARETKNSNAEVDYVLQVSGSVVPVEVKAGATGRLRSLQMMVQEKDLPLAVRVCSQPMQYSELQTALPVGPSRNFKLLSIPFYMVSELPRLLAAELAGR